MRHTSSPLQPYSSQISPLLAYNLYNHLPHTNLSYRFSTIFTTTISTSTQSTVYLSPLQQLPIYNYLHLYVYSIPITSTTTTYLPIRPFSYLYFVLFLYPFPFLLKPPYPHPSLTTPHPLTSSMACQFQSSPSQPRQSWPWSSTALLQQPPEI